MADPLSIAASIIGLLAAAGKVSEALGPLISNFKDTPRIATSIYAEVNSSRIILGALETIFHDLSRTPVSRRQLIQVDHLIATLTDGVLIFNELEPLVLQLGTSTERWRTRMRWTREKGSLDSFVSRLQLFKVSVTVMLNILQCESDLEASRNQRELQALTNSLLESNREIAGRLARLEQPPLGTTRAASIPNDDRTPTMTSTTYMNSFAFDSDLQRSWVYQRMLRPSDDVSCRQSIALSHAWSTFSDVSLSEISLISAVVLPISSNDLVNRYHYQQNESPSPQASATLGDSSNPRFWPFGIQEFNGLDGKWSHEPSSALDEEPQAPWEDFGSYEADEEEAVRELHVRDVHYNTPEVSVPGTLHEGQMAESKLQTLVPVPMDQSNSNPLPQNITPQGDAAEDEASDHVNKLPIPAVLPFGESAEICGTIGDSTSDPSAQEPTFPRDLSEIYAAINWPTLSVPEKVRTRDGADDSDTLQENLGDADEQQLKGPQDILTSQVKNHLAGMKAATLSPQDALYDADSETMRSRSRSPRLGATEKRRIKSPSALPKKYKLVVLGARDTDITMQFFDGDIINEYDPMIDGTCVRKCVIDEEAAHLEILDTTIGEENSDMQEQYLRTGDGFLILYNVASRATFEDISTLQRQVLKAKGKDYWPMVWVGYHGNLEEQREITLTQGEMTARKCGCAFFEVSTDLKDNIEKAFFELVRDIRRYNVFDEKWKRMEKKNYPAKIKPTQKQTRKRGVSPSRRRRRARNTSQGVIQERFGNMKIE